MASKTFIINATDKLATKEQLINVTSVVSGFSNLISDLQANKEDIGDHNNDIANLQTQIDNIHIGSGFDFQDISSLFTNSNNTITGQLPYQPDKFLKFDLSIQVSDGFSFRPLTLSQWIGKFVFPANGIYTILHTFYISGNTYTLVLKFSLSRTTNIVSCSLYVTYQAGFQLPNDLANTVALSNTFQIVLESRD